MSKQEMQPVGTVCTEDKILSDKKQQVHNDLRQKDEHILKLEMDLDVERQLKADYKLKYTMTVQVRFASTQ
jgi:hypothetical protein